MKKINSQCYPKSAKLLHYSLSRQNSKKKLHRFYLSQEIFDIAIGYTVACFSIFGTKNHLVPTTVLYELLSSTNCCLVPTAVQYRLLPSTTTDLPLSKQILHLRGRLVLLCYARLCDDARLLSQSGPSLLCQAL